MSAPQTSLKRILFAGIRDECRFVSSISSPMSSSVPQSVSTDFEDLKNNCIHLAGYNTGNMFIGESIMRIFEFDRAKSVYVDFIGLFNAINDSEKFNNFIKNNFDAVIISVANFIRPKTDMGVFAQAVESIKDTDIFLFGAGMEEPLKDINELTPGTIHFLREIEKKAKIFGVRGESTKKWLDSVGIKNSVALGCPSMYLYPFNILSIKEGSKIKIKNILFAGHIQNIDSGNLLLKPLQNNNNNSNNYNFDYLLQDEIYTENLRLSNYLRDKCYYNSATGELDTKLIIEAMQSNKKYSFNVPFNKMYYFNNPDSWRHCCHRYDLYVGDRFHGGVAALQSGVSAIIIGNSLRVQEMVDFFKIPSLTLDEFSNCDFEQMINNKLSSSSIQEFKDRYLLRLNNFVKLTESKGLILSDKKIKELLIKDN